MRDSNGREVKVGYVLKRGIWFYGVGNVGTEYCYTTIRYDTVEACREAMEMGSFPLTWSADKISKMTIQESRLLGVYDKNNDEWMEGDSCEMCDVFDGIKSMNKDGYDMVLVKDEEYYKGWCCLWSVSKAISRPAWNKAPLKSKEKEEKITMSDKVRDQLIASTLECLKSCLEETIRRAEES